MVGDQTFLNLDAVAWTAIGTMALALTTLGYVILTGRLNRHARDAAQAAKRAAASAAATALATREAAAIAEAGLDVQFDAEYIGFLTSDAPGGVVRVASKGPTIYLHEARVGYVSNRIDLSTPAEATGATLVPTETSPLPMRLYAGTGALFVWPGAPLTTSEILGSLDVTYSVLEDGPRRQRHVDLQVVFLPGPPQATER